MQESGQVNVLAGLSQRRCP